MTFSKKIQFKHTWREYQQHVLDDAWRYLSDGHLHVVAAPGSGKTVLGLEIMRGLDAPTLILAPTIAIRNQWVDRFTELFLDGANPNWISTNIKRPGKMTVITYQSLFATTKKNQEQKDKIFAELKNKGIHTLVVDEAHHLRNEWWKSLQQLKTYLRPTVVALTATPPYDTDSGEWRRYVDFCGPIDIEVTVPELVARGDLCPHQDFIYYSQLTDKEQEHVQAIKERLAAFLHSLAEDTELIEILKQHPVVADPKLYEKSLFEQTEYFSSIGAYLNKVGHYQAVKKMMRYIAGSLTNVNPPSFLEQQAETLLTGVIFKDKYIKNKYPEFVETIKKRARSYGVIEFNRVLFSSNAEISKTVRNSSSKLDGIKKVVVSEYSGLGNDLSCVVLTDYIRKTALESASVAHSKIGVVPIFEELRKAKITPQTAILTGSIIVIPESLKADFKDNLKASMPSNKQATVRFLKYPHDSSFVLANVQDASRQYVVAAMTRLFEGKKINVLIGTRALLGEGWDAPAMNTLLLASTVRSFMSSNQMRGRAIRVSGTRPNKVANIWHFACIAPNSNRVLSINNRTPDFGEDYLMLERRFRTFVGVSVHKVSIESGLPRATYLSPTVSASFNAAGKISVANEQTFSMAHLRGQTSEKWRNSLASGEIGQVIQSLRTPKRALPRRGIYLKSWLTIAAAGAYTTLGYAQNAPDAYRSWTHLSQNSDGQFALFAILTGILGIAVYYTLRTLKFMFLHRTSKASFKTVGNVIVKSLREVGELATDESLIRVETTRGPSGLVRVGLAGASTHESSVFIQAVEEVLSPVDNPRYIFADVRSRGIHKYLQFLKIKTYRPVPKVFAVHKKRVAVFVHNWQKYIGPASATYTRSVKGRRLLLRARYKSQESITNKEISKLSIWQ